MSKRGTNTAKFLNGRIKGRSKSGGGSNYNKSIRLNKSKIIDVKSEYKLVGFEKLAKYSKAQLIEYYYKIKDAYENTIFNNKVELYKYYRQVERSMENENDLLWAIIMLQNRMRFFIKKTND